MPPKRMPLWQLGAVQALVFGVGWGAFMYHLSWKEKGTSIAFAIGLSVLAGVLFGASMMWFEARRRKREDEASSANLIDDKDDSKPSD